MKEKVIKILEELCDNNIVKENLEYLVVMI